MKNPLFSKGMIISLAGHLAAFSIFSFSFGNILELPNYNFGGSVLAVRDLTNPLLGSFINIKHKPITISAETKISSSFASRSASNETKLPIFQLKPQVALINNKEKPVFVKPAGSFSRAQKRAAIIFYPQLPRSFIVYFQDRQTVHIELNFNITSNRSINSVIVQRKISSGNLDADLLSARYISRYLFMQQGRFPLNSEQTVKIDLSTKNQ